jgi:hypothetical protein
MHIHNWAQWSIIGLSFFGLLVGANQHGKVKLKKESFWETAVAIGLQLTLVYFAGGFR